jgi:predicted phosphohydrolase
LFKEAFYGSSDFEYPKVDIIDKILFIGLDSTAEELHWYDSMLAQGEIGIAQLKELESILNKTEYSKLKKVVYLHHHPFDFNAGLRLKDRKKLKPIIENKIDALLFGHLHGDSNSVGKDFNCSWGIPRAYNAGSATHKNGNPGIHRVINLKKMAREDYDGKFI